MTSMYFGNNIGIMCGSTVIPKKTMPIEAKIVIFLILMIKDKIKSDNKYLRKSAIEVADDVFQFIINWFLEHISGSDRKYVDLFKENNIK